jgi:hypothetical protein
VAVIIGVLSVAVREARNAVIAVDEAISNVMPAEAAVTAACAGVKVKSCVIGAAAVERLSPAKTAADVTVTAISSAVIVTEKATVSNAMKGGIIAAQDDWIARNVTVPAD